MFRFQLYVLSSIYCSGGWAKVLNSKYLSAGKSINRVGADLQSQLSSIKDASLRSKEMSSTKQSVILRLIHLERVGFFLEISLGLLPRGEEVGQDFRKEAWSQTALHKVVSTEWWREMIIN